jgi:protein tyrosine/serine phosphatase
VAQLILNYRKTLLSLIAGLVVPLTLACQSVCAQPWKTVGDLPNYHSVAPGLFRGGQPSAVGLKTLKENGIATIISLRNNKILTEAESQEAKKLGLTFYSLPLNGLWKPSDETIHRFLNIVNNPESGPVFVHCEEGVDRTGTLIAIYRIENQHWTAQNAYKEMLELGFHTKYPWMSDSVFDWEEKKGLEQSSSRPVVVKMLDSVEHLLSFLRL